MRVTRHPYEIEGWGVGELWVGDGRVVVAHDPPTPGVSFAGASAASRPQPHRPETSPRGTAGVPTETLASDPQQETNGFVSDLVREGGRIVTGEAMIRELRLCRIALLVTHRPVDAGHRQKRQ